jgi:hypothetical protein
MADDHVCAGVTESIQRSPVELTTTAWLPSAEQSTEVKLEVLVS